MLSALLQALSPDFHMCVFSGGEEGKKSYIMCIKKMKVALLMVFSNIGVYPVMH